MNKKKNKHTAVKMNTNKIKLKYYLIITENLKNPCNLITTMYQIACTQFSEATYTDNLRFRETNNIGCIYCSPVPTNEKYSPETHLFVVEMNNTTNQMMGIGLIKNKRQADKTYLVHDTSNAACNYNRYIYKGERRLAREELPEEMVDIFDKILFKGKSHLKRLRGLSVVTSKVFDRWNYERTEVLEKVLKAFNITF